MKLGNEETLQRIKGGLIVSCQGAAGGAAPQLIYHGAYGTGGFSGRSRGNPG